MNGRKIVEITEEQVREFAGNAIELMGKDGEGNPERIMAMSARALRSLTAAQVAAIEESCRIVAVDIPTIELAGGSVRCMIAGIHLDKRRDVERTFTEAVQAIDEHPHSLDGLEVRND